MLIDGSLHDQWLEGTENRESDHTNQTANEHQSIGLDVMKQALKQAYIEDFFLLFGHLTLIFYG